MTCRDEILAAVDAITARAGDEYFTPQEVIDYMRQVGTAYSDATIRVHISARMCINSPKHHKKKYDDFERIMHGLYRVLPRLRSRGPRSDSSTSNPLSRSQLIKRAKNLLKRRPEFRSLCRGHTYELVSVSMTTGEIAIRFQSGAVHRVAVQDLIAFLGELYRVGCLPRDYFRDPANSLRVFGTKSWHAPGAAMFALIPVLDERARVTSHCGLAVLRKGEAP